jgi:tetratricopeptide (TPR) repeat protein
LIEKGRNLLKKGGTEAACISFRRATIALPTWWIARFEYVRCARLLGAPFDEMVDHLGIALKADPTKPALYHLLGVVHEDHGGIERAKNAYEKAIELAPWMVEVQLRRGLLAIQEKNLKRAETAFKSVLKHKSTNLIARNHLADIYLATGRKREAISHLQFVLKVTRYPGPTLARLAQLYGVLGMNADRARIIRRLTNP